MAKWNLLEFPVPTQYLNIELGLSKSDHSKLLVRFLIHVNFDESGCWLWDGANISSNPNKQYGQLKWRNTHFLAHRLSMFLAGRSPLNGLNILHECDTPRCVNPDHLKPGTHIENMQDMRMKGRGRSLQGSQIKTAILNEDKVKEIRSARKGGIGRNVLADMYGVAISTIADVELRRSWTHVI